MWCPETGSGDGDEVWTLFMKSFGIKLKPKVKLAYLVLVGLSVGEVGRLSCLPSEQSVEVGTCLTIAHDVRFILKKLRKGMRNPPCLCLPPCSTVWHWAHAFVKIFFPASADILSSSCFSAISYIFRDSWQFWMEIWPRSIFCWAEGSNVLPKALNSKLHTIRQHFIDVHIIFDASRMFHSDRSVCSRHWRYFWALSDSWSCCVQGTCWLWQVGGKFLGSVPGLRALHSLHLLLELRDGELDQFSLLV